MSAAFPILKTKRLLLRNFNSIDIENVFSGLSDPDVVKYYGVSYRTLEETKEQMTFFSDLLKNDTGIWWAVCSLENGTFYGAGGLNNLSRKDRKAEIGFWLLKHHWGKGIMNEAMPLIINYGFHDLKLHRIEGFVETENINCKKGIERSGFILEGTMKDCEYKNERFISLDIYAMLGPVMSDL
jgi:ribosomal-protein-alanine N-acetyltransferase